MKLYKLVASSIALLVCVNLAVAQDQTEPNGEVDLKEWNAARLNWYRVSEDRTSNSSDVRSAYEFVQSSWDKLPLYWKKDTSPAGAPARVSAAVEASELFADAGAPEEAIMALQEGARLSQELRVPFSQGRTDNTFRNRASVHGRLFAQTGKDPLQGSEIGYELWKHGNGYVALQEGGVWEQAASLFGDDPSLLLASEGEGKMALLDSNGRIVQELSVAIAKGSGPPKSRLTAILKHESAQPESAGRFLRQNPETFFAAQADTTSTAKSASPVSLPSPKTGSQDTPANPKSATPSEEPTSSTPWSIIVVLIVAVLGLLWLVLKRRS
jgi:hypothetical protein